MHFWLLPDSVKLDSHSAIWDSAKWQDTKLAVLSKSYAIQELNVTILLMAAIAKLRHSVCGKRSVNISKFFAFSVYTRNLYQRNESGKNTEKCPLIYLFL